MWPKLRFPALAVSLLFLAYSLCVFIAAPGDRIFDVVHPIEAYRASQRDVANKARAMDYAHRLRADADRLNAEGDYINALGRLTQAEEWDRPGDRAPKVRQMRATLQTKIHLMTTPPDNPRRDEPISPSDAPSADPPPKAP